jgi:alpha-D-ribose 1-methylphosphonate 5-triphosphate diphosphatase
MLIKNLRIVLPDTLIERGSLRIAGQRIVELAEGDLPAGGARVIDGGGLTAIPGIIDIHGDMLEREIEPRPGASFPAELAIFELDKRLVAAGVTTAYAALSFIAVDDDGSVRKLSRVLDTLATIERLRPALLSELFVHARFEVATPSVAGALVDAIEAGHVQLLSLMDHTPGQGQYRNIEQYVGFMIKWRRVDRAMVEAEISERIAKAEPQANWLLARDIATLAAQRGIALASHDDDTLEKVDLVASLGATICEFPVTLEAAEEARRRGMHVVMGAPNALRGTSHSGNLSAREAITAGVVDLLAADYHPASLVQAAFRIASEGLLGLPAAVALVSANPAAALGLADRGRIAPGMRADIALVEAQPATTPRVRATIRNGIPTYWDASMFGRDC